MNIHHLSAGLLICLLAACSSSGSGGSDTAPPTTDAIVAADTRVTDARAPDGQVVPTPDQGLADAAHFADAGGDVAPPTPDAAPPDARGPDAAPVPTDAAPPAPDGPATRPPPPPGGPPNFIFILGEARGWTSTSVQQDEDIADSRSSMFLTPNLDRVAAEGMTFSDFYAPSPRCMPSRASYFAGRSPAQIHMTFIPENGRDGTPVGNVVPPMPLTTLPPDLLNVASMLKSVGYATAHFGKWHAGNINPSMYGFDESDGPTTNVGPAGDVHPNPIEAFGITERGIDFMLRQTEAGHPFYLQLSHYGGTDQANSLPDTYAAEAARLAGHSAKDIADSAVIRDMDTTIGQVLDELDTLGIADRTYIFFSADHGRSGANANEPLNQGKGTVWEGGIRVPLLIRGPGIPQGTHSHVRATQVDLLPTMAELAQVPGPLPAELEGGSLWSVLTSGTGEVARSREAFVVHFPHYDKDPAGPASAIILGPYKLIHFYEDDSLHLYDIEQDYAEQHDLAAQMPDRVQELSQRMADYLTAVGAQMPGHL